MARLTRPTTETLQKPATKYLEWKSNNRAFEYYDKDQKETENKGKVKVELPLKLLFLEHYHTVKGWNDAANSGIWSNEVYGISKEPLKVQCSNGVIAEGIYSEKRTDIRNAGGVYHRSIYCMTPEGDIINLQLKGAVIGGIGVENSVDKKEHLGWSTFYSGDRKRNIKGVNHLLDNQWLEINAFAEGKKGAVKYAIPTFSLGSVLTPEENKLADVAAAKLQAYMNSYFKVDNIEVVDEEVVEVETAEELEF